MADKLVKCPVCGTEMASKAKSCPQCGAKNKKPFYKKWWFYAIIAVLVIGGIGSAGNASSGGSGSAPAPTAAPKDTEVQQETPVSYEHHEVTELFDALKDNALKAENTYQDQYVELEGYLGTIDSDGKYIGVGAASSDYNYLLDEVQCYIKNDEQKKQILNMSKGDSIVVRGKIKSIGEILGYQLDIDSIN